LDPARFGATLDAIAERYDGIDLLYYGPAVMTDRPKPIVETDAEAVRDAMGVVRSRQEEFGAVEIAPSIPMTSPTPPGRCTPGVTSPRRRSMPSAKGVGSFLCRVRQRRWRLQRTPRRWRY
jgi:hypothetical protein